MRAEIAQLQRSLGTTTIYVTHDQTEAMTLGTRVAVISGGVLQQIAAPQDLYRNPANLFVAGFIGAPPMNLIDARLERAGAPGNGQGGPVVTFGPHHLGVPPDVVAAHPGLDRYLGAPIVLGIRPEHLRDAALAGPSGPSAVLTLPIRLREELGSEVHLHGAIGAAAHAAGSDADDVRSLATIVARTDPHTRIAEGETASLAVDVSAIQFFDPATGATIRA
jgi:multiple sugar transport system ATP-binding protein